MWEKSIDFRVLSIIDPPLPIHKSNHPTHAFHHPVHVSNHPIHELNLPILMSNHPTHPITSYMYSTTPLGGWVFSSPNFGSQCPWYESSWRRNSAFDYGAYCTDPFISALLLSLYHLINVDWKDCKTPNYTHPTNAYMNLTTTYLHLTT